MDTQQYAREVNIVIETQMQDQRFTQPAMKLIDAKALVLDGKVQPQADGTYLVQGSEATPYLWHPETGCSCAHATKGHQYCKHAVAVVLFQKVQQALGTPQGARPLPPQTADERMAQWVPASPEEACLEEDYPPLRLDTDPETEADLDALAAAQAPVPVPTVRLPAIVSQGAQDLAASLAEWGAKRAVLTQFIRQHLVEGVDYGKIHVAKSCDRKYDCTNPQHLSKPVLFKAGSEKVLGLLRLRPVFSRDDDTWEMLGRPAGVLCLRCTLLTASGEIAGEGRGARDVQRDGGDTNRTIKMASKSAQMDATLRTGILSDAFTQDLEEGQEDDPLPPPAASPGLDTAAAKRRIMAMLQAQGKATRTREEVQRAVLDLTGLPLEERHFGEIVRRLEYYVPAQGVA